MAAVDPTDDAAPADTSPMTDEELADIDEGRVGCRCSRLRGEVARLRDALDDAEHYATLG